MTCRALPGFSCEVLLGEEFCVVGRIEKVCIFTERVLLTLFSLLAFISKMNIILIRCIFAFLAWK